ANGNWTYTPSKDYNGSDSFTITVSDGKGGTATSTVNIGVTPVNDPPKFDDPSNPNYDPVTGNYKATTPEDTPVSGTVKAKDADGDALTFAKGNNPAHGTVVVNADGTWTYTPSKDYNGSDSFTITVSDGKGGTATSTVNIGVTPVNDAPVISAAGSASIDEANLISATAGTSTTGKLAISDVDSTRFDIQLSAPAGNWTSKGVAITWSGGSAGSPLVGSADGKEVVRVAIDDQGQYKVTLSQSIDHPTAGGANTSTLSFGVKVGDGTSTASTSLNVNVLDDVPNTTTSTEHVAVQHDVIRVQGLQVSFANDTYANGTSTVSRTNTDADAGIDRLRWGSGVTTGQQSGYDLVDNSALSSSSGTVVEASQVFKLADFTHSNYGIYSDSSTLTGTDFNMTLVVNINGVATTVTFKTKLTHTETANSNDAAASADIITLQSQTATVTVDGTQYKINLLGFQDASGKLVNTIYTNEQASNTFGIYGSIVSADTLPTVQGKLDTSDVSADGISQVIWDTVSSPYGTFVGKSDGSYTFEVNRATRDQLDPGETRTQKVTYTLVDGDGDRVTGELNIAMDGYNHIEGTNTANTLTGTTGNDHIDGMAGNDTLSGGGGQDILVGGKGDDRLTGGDGSDVFAWHLGDGGAKGQPAVDVITDFNTAAASNNGDVLDLRDLLQGETQDNLLQYLDFDTTSTPGSTHIRISTTGAFTDTATDSGAEDQRITLSNVDLRASLGLDAQASDHQIISELMQRGKLLVDQG
ncbi:MAG: tandem-95 repeat protein, partial [Gammaproteobacteria bacterium]|nr:tandem-95 repeat protein [Gammaproteobacteria bacterium]